ncbi:MAG: hypothetical protein IEMM0002_1307 [bacterium]|nr:MAG: hypothetical protein IEMM0002_1307 [bacterium]
MKCLRLINVLAMFALASCSTAPPPDPAHENSSGIGITMSVKNPSKRREHSPQTKMDEIYLVRLDKYDDPLERSAFIPSNYSSDGVLYFLDLEPGRYSAVAGYYISDDVYSAGCSVRTICRYVGVYFDKKLIEATEVSVTPGRVVFMGDIVVSINSFYSGEPDGAQKLLYDRRLLAESGLSGGSMSKVSRNAAAEKIFLMTTKKQFEGSKWEKMVSRQLRDLKREGT